MKKFKIVRYLVIIFLVLLFDNLPLPHYAEAVTEEQAQAVYDNSPVRKEISLTGNARGQYFTIIVNGYYYDPGKRGCSLEQALLIDEYVTKIYSYLIKNGRFEWQILKDKNEIGRITVHFNYENRPRAKVQIFMERETAKNDIRMDSKNYVKRVAERLETMIMDKYNIR